MKKPYVAIVDDDSAFSAYLRGFLSLRGYEARCYSRGDEMLASIGAERVTGHGVARRDDARTRTACRTLESDQGKPARAQVIMLSGRDQVSTIVEAVRLGAADYVVKPDDPKASAKLRSTSQSRTRSRKPAWYPRSRSSGS